MKWKLSFAQKVRATAALAVVFLLVLATNMMDSHHFTVVQQSLTTVYEDRLVVKDYIYKITRQLQHKKNALEDNDKIELAKINKEANDSIQVLVEKFSNTKLTSKEAQHFESLQANLKRLQNQELKLTEGEVLDKEMFTLNIEKSYYSEIMKDLDALSEIQVMEGAREINNSNRAIDASNMISRFEIGALILIGVFIQLLIFLKPMK